MEGFYRSWRHRDFFPLGGVLSSKGQVSKGRKRALTSHSQGFLANFKSNGKVLTMTKSTGIGRGGARKGAGRRSAAASVDWDELGRAYFTGTQSLDGILARFGVSYGDLLAHGAASHWMQRRPTRAHPDDLGSLASALAIAMWEVDHTAGRARRFVAAMVALGEHEIEIAQALNIPVEVLRREFGKELAAAR
jgi:hypothetical protein